MNEESTANRGGLVKRKEYTLAPQSGLLPLFLIRSLILLPLACAISLLLLAVSVTRCTKQPNGLDVNSIHVALTPQSRLQKIIGSATGLTEILAA